MSSFNCEHCGTAILDSPRGYYTSCEHYKAENVNRFLSRHLEGECHCRVGTTCKICSPDVVEKLNNLKKSQVDIPNDFRVVLNELTSNSVEVNNQGNINDKDI